MKRTLFFLAGILLVTTFGIWPVHAIFHWKACENTRSSILAEERVGKELWANFNTSVTANEKTSASDSTWTLTMNRQAVLVYKSDLKIFGLAEQRSSCFNPKQNAFIQDQESQTLYTMQILQTNLDESIKSRSTWAHVSMKNLYPSYASLYDTLKTLK
jgi:hypothetical protein